MDRNSVVILIPPYLGEKILDMVEEDLGETLVGSGGILVVEEDTGVVGAAEVEIGEAIILRGLGGEVVISRVLGLAVAGTVLGETRTRWSMRMHSG